MENVLRDFVQREVVIQGSVERVFSALTDPATFPTWGPVSVEGLLAPGEKPVLDFGASGKVRVHVVAIEKPSYFAYRWAQGETDPIKLLNDPLDMLNTLVEFHIEPIEEGTRVRVVESGLSALPQLVSEALQGMEAGWSLMIGALRKAVEGIPDEVSNTAKTEVELKASPAKVFHALAHPEEWWAQQVEGSLAPGSRQTLDFGPFGKWVIDVVAVEPPAYLAYKRVEGPMPDSPSGNLIEFRLEPTPQGTKLTQSESGFDALPEDGREVAYRTAQQVWGIVLSMLEGHLAKES